MLAADINRDEVLDAVVETASLPFWWPVLVLTIWAVLSPLTRWSVEKLRTAVWRAHVRTLVGEKSRDRADTALRRVAWFAHGGGLQRCAHPVRLLRATTGKGVLTP